MNKDEVQESVEVPQEDVAVQEVEAREPEVVQPEKAWDDEVEREARSFGWKSPDEWKGDIPPGYIDNPTEYIDRLERSTPFRKMREQLQGAETKFQEQLRKITAAQEAGHKREVERQKQDYERQMQMIASAQRRAAEEGDVERFDQLENQRRTMKAPVDTPPPVEMPQVDPLAEISVSKPWVNDPVLRRAGADIIDAAFKAGALPPNASVQDQVEFAEQKVRGYYPQLFQSEDRPKPKAKVDGGGLAIGKKTGFDALPSDAKAAFNDQVRKGIFEDTKEDREFYFNEYNRA